MKTFAAFLIVIGLLLVCLIGVCAALLGLHRVDAWCRRQLTDGQAELDAMNSNGRFL